MYDLNSVLDEFLPGPSVYVWTYRDADGEPLGSLEAKNVKEAERLAGERWPTESPVMESAIRKGFLG